jgi:Domain of unknown function (DUF4333)
VHDPLPQTPTRLLAAATALVAAVAVSACGSSAKYLDREKVERAIASSVLREHHIYTTVACPSKIPQTAGHAFTCTARLSVGAYPVNVTETDGDGHVRYQDERPLVVLDIARVQHAIEASVLDQRGVRAAVSCPAEVLQQAGITFRCTAAVDPGARSYPFVVTEVDGAGHLRYLGT